MLCHIHADLIVHLDLSGPRALFFLVDLCVIQAFYKAVFTHPREPDPESSPDPQGLVQISCRNDGAVIHIGHHDLVPEHFLRRLCHCHFRLLLSIKNRGRKLSRLLFSIHVVIYLRNIIAVD